MEHQARIVALRESLARTVVGQQTLLDSLVIGLLTGGHILVEGLPGLAKSTAVTALARQVHARFQRIQFTPDLLPGDLTGSEIYHPDTHEFEFREGPIFNEILLADEINRAPAKVQSALLEAMQEHQVTVGGESRPLPELFMVMATQNPMEQAGTYPLPEAQLDRFLMQVVIDYPAEEEELEILRRHRGRGQGEAPAGPDDGVTVDDVLAARREVREIRLDPSLEAYIVSLTTATRDPGQWLPEERDTLALGASPRATLSMAEAARAEAYLRGREYVVPDDIAAVAHGCLRHRLALSVEARMEGRSLTRLIDRLLDTVPLP